MNKYIMHEGNMKIKFLSTLMAIIIITGCSTRGNTTDSNLTTHEIQTTNDTKTVQPTDLKIRSTYKNITTWNNGQKFWNVIGSTDDPKIDGKSWIAVYREKCGINPGNMSATGAVCSKNALGGHVVKDGQSQYPEKNSTVYIVPICSGENSRPSVEMTVSPASICAVELNYWMK
ncbi:hypothetical protein CWS43_23470 [Rahnella sp. AA]|nr:hypothetical protein CWS43_23470 [Rahnella sp. AA]